MNFDPYAKVAHQEPSPPQQLKVLWRAQAGQRVVAAALYRHHAGTELRVYREPENADDVIETRVDRFNVGVLETRAETVRRLLVAKGWTELA